MVESEEARSRPGAKSALRATSRENAEAHEPSIEMPPASDIDLRQDSAGRPAITDADLRAREDLLGRSDSHKVETIVCRRRHATLGAPPSDRSRPATLSNTSPTDQSSSVRADGKAIVRIKFS